MLCRKTMWFFVEKRRISRKDRTKWYREVLKEDPQHVWMENTSTSLLFVYISVL